MPTISAQDCPSCCRLTRALGYHGLVGFWANQYHSRPRATGGMTQVGVLTSAGQMRGKAADREHRVAGRN